VSKVWHPLVGSMVMSLTALVVPETLFLGYQGVDFMLKSDASLYSLMAAGTLLVIAGTKGDSAVTRLYQTRTPRGSSRGPAG
jgi:H+/Cl- antiporter ClcA